MNSFARATAGAVTTARLNGPRVPALYSVVVTHTRRAPVKNHFRYKASYWLVDYDASASTGRPCVAPRPIRTQ